MQTYSDSLMILVVSQELSLANRGLFFVNCHKHFSSFSMMQATFSYSDGKQFSSPQFELDGVSVDTSEHQLAVNEKQNIVNRKTAEEPKYPLNNNLVGCGI